jgi:hypothetical protein
MKITGTSVGIAGRDTPLNQVRCTPGTENIEVLPVDFQPPLIEGVPIQVLAINFSAEKETGKDENGCFSYHLIINILMGVKGMNLNPPVWCQILYL